MQSVGIQLMPINKGQLGLFFRDFDNPCTRNGRTSFISQCLARLLLNAEWLENVFPPVILPEPLRVKLKGFCSSGCDPAEFQLSAI